MDAKGRRMNLRIGLLNMMADGALRATERQFQRLLLEPGPQGDASALVAFRVCQLNCVCSLPHFRPAPGPGT